MNLIDTYVSEVGRRLPAKNRADIEAEIRSILEDTLEERSRQEERPIDDSMVFDVLKEYGDPEKVAASYLPARYLIGPTLYPVFWGLAKVIVIITLILVLVGLGVNLGQSAHDFQTGVQILGQAISSFFTSILSALGTLIFLFAIIEWAVNYSGGKMDERELPGKKQWDPHALVKMTPPDRIKFGDTIVEIIFTAFALILFNFYPQFFNLGYSSNGNWFIGTGNWTSVPVLSAAFFHFIPYLTIVWLLTIVLDIILLRQGYWNMATRSFSIGLKVISIAIAAAMLAGPSLIALTAANLPATVSHIETLRVLMDILPQFIRVALWLSILGNTVEIIKNLVKMISNKPFSFALPGKSS